MESQMPFILREWFPYELLSAVFEPVFFKSRRIKLWDSSTWRIRTVYITRHIHFRRKNTARTVFRGSSNDLKFAENKPLAPEINYDSPDSAPNTAPGPHEKFA